MVQINGKRYDSLGCARFRRSKTMEFNRIVKGVICFKSFVFDWNGLKVLSVHICTFRFVSFRFACHSFELGKTYFPPFSFLLSYSMKTVDIVQRNDTKCHMCINFFGGFPSTHFEIWIHLYYCRMTSEFLLDMGTGQRRRRRGARKRTRTSVSLKSLFLIEISTGIIVWAWLMQKCNAYL